MNGHPARCLSVLGRDAFDAVGVGSNFIHAVREMYSLA